MKYIYILVCVCISLQTLSQPTKKSNRFGIGLSYNVKNNEQYEPFFNEKKKFNSFKLEFTYSINRFFDIGAYASRTYYKDVFNRLEPSYNTFGAKGELQISPFFIKRKCRWNLYVPLGIGVSQLIFPDKIIKNVTNFDCLFGVGTSFFIIKNVGIFADYIFENKVKNKFRPYLFAGIKVVF